MAELLEYILYGIQIPWNTRLLGIEEPASYGMLELNTDSCELLSFFFLSGVPDFFDRNKILSGGDLSHYQVPHCIRVFFYFVWFVFIHHNFQFYFELCTYCNILDINLS